MSLQDMGISISYRDIFYLVTNHPLVFIYPEKDLHKGTSEAPVLSSSEREHRSKRISLWGEGKRKRFPM